MTPATAVAPPQEPDAQIAAVDPVDAALGTLGGDQQSRAEQVTIAVFIVLPFLAVAAAISVAWGGWLGWTDVAIAFVMYGITGHGITVGFHRYFPHKSFKPNRGVKIAL